MRKTTSIHLSFVLAVAGALTACEKTEVRRCVDNQNRVVEDTNCANQQAGPTFHPIYFWHYGGVSGPSRGDTVVGGSRMATPGARAVSPVSRGGFGSIGAGAGE